ncbi:unnamed protein product, partial [marine sediment metagenome]
PYGKSGYEFFAGRGQDALAADCPRTAPKRGQQNNPHAVALLMPARRGSIQKVDRGA